MQGKNHIAAAVRRALVMGALTAAGSAPAVAQESLDEIVVTGSRIRSANLESTTPVTQVTAADVAELQKSLPNCKVDHDPAPEAGAAGDAD